MRSRVVLIVLLALPTNVFAGEPWNKQPQHWNLAEVYQILNDSPWSPARTSVEITLKERRTDPLTKQEVNPPEGALYGPPAPVVGMGTRREPASRVPVLWWSAKTVRLAQQRLRQLRDSVAKKDLLLRADELSDFVLVVEGAEALRILRDAAEDLRETVFLELPNRLPLEVTTIHFVKAEKAGEDRVEFHFPRQIEGQVTLSPDTESVVFHCKATAKTTRPGRPNSLAIQAAFEPRKMRTAGRPDL